MTDEGRDNEYSDRSSSLSGENELGRRTEAFTYRGSGLEALLKVFTPFLFFIGAVSFTMRDCYLSHRRLPEVYQRQLELKRYEEQLELEQKVITSNDLTPVLSPEHVISVGDKAVVPKSDWVKVLNDEPISNGNSLIERGDTRRIKTGGVVKAIGLSPPNRVIVEYSPVQSAGGASCPSGAIFEISREKFNDMTRAYRKKISKTSQLRRDVETIVSGGTRESIYYNGVEISVGDKIDIQSSGGVYVMNPSPIRSHNDIFSFNNFGDFDDCSYKPRGSSRAIGFTDDDRVLVEYTSPDEVVMGASCPSGTMYLTTPEGFLSGMNNRSKFSQ